MGIDGSYNHIWIIYAHIWTIYDHIRSIFDDIWSAYSMTLRAGGPTEDQWKRKEHHRQSSGKLWITIKSYGQPWKTNGKPKKTNEDLTKTAEPMVGSCECSNWLQHQWIAFAPPEPLSRSRWGFRAEKHIGKILWDPCSKVHRLCFMVHSLHHVLLSTLHSTTR